MTDREDRIRELAYLLWLEEGCPEGQQERHWRTAQTQFDSESERKRIEGEHPGDPAAFDPSESAMAQIPRRRAVSGKDR
jgi:hypothetical protein